MKFLKMKSAFTQDHKPGIYDRLSEHLQILHRQVAQKLNRYTARWPPVRWKIVLAVFCLFTGAYCLWLAVHNWL